MPEIQFRISDNDPYVYMEPTTAGSVAVGTDDADSDKFKVVMSDATSDLAPGSGTIAAGSCSVSIDPRVNGNIEFCPKGSGQTIFARGSVAIEGQAGTAGNLLMQNTTASGLAGVIEYGGDRFIHKFGTDNTFVGEFAGTFSLTTGSAFGNTSIGANTLNDLTVGAYNTAVGLRAGTAITTGNQNNVFGQDALAALTTGSYNAAIGANSGVSLQTGSYNTLIGFQVGDNYTTSESSNIILGNNVHGTVGESNTIRIGQQGGSGGQQNRCFVAGIVGVTLGAPVGPLEIDASGQIGVGSASGGFTWNEVTGASQAADANTGYIANRAGLVTITLIAAASAAIGTTLRVTGINTALGWAIAQNASQQIFFGSASTTAGVTGSLASTATRDSVELVCVSANGLLWNVISSVGNITVT